MVAAHTFTKAPLSTFSTQLRVPEYDSPKKSELRVRNEGDPKMTKSGEKRRPGTVTFGEVTYI